MIPFPGSQYSKASQEVDVASALPPKPVYKRQDAKDPDPVSTPIQSSSESIEVTSPAPEERPVQEERPEPEPVFDDSAEPTWDEPVKEPEDNTGLWIGLGALGTVITGLLWAISRHK